MEENRWKLMETITVADRSPARGQSLDRLYFCLNKRIFSARCYCCCDIKMKHEVKRAKEYGKIRSAQKR